MGYSLDIENIGGNFELDFMIIDSIGNPADNVEIRIGYEWVNGAGIEMTGNRKINNEWFVRKLFP